MRLLLRSEFRYLGRTVGSTLASFAGISLGIASIVAVHLIGDTVNAGLADAALLPGYTHRIRAADGAELRESDYFRLRSRWRSGAISGIEAMVPVLEGYALSTDGRVRHIIGLDPLAAGMAQRTAARPQQASAPAGGETENGRMSLTALTRFINDDVVRVAGDSDLTSGDVLDFGDGVARRTVEVVATQRLRHTERLLADLPTAQRVLRAEGELSAIWVRAPDVLDVAFEILERLFPGISAAFYKPVALQLGPSYAVEDAASWDPTRSFARAVVFNVGALGLLALFVAGFILYQAVHSNVIRRRREHARLFAMGVARSQLRLILVAEGAVLGVAGGATGIVLGWALAQGLIDDTPVELVAPNAWVLAKALGGGLGVGAFGALLATRAADGTGRARDRIRMVVLCLAVAAVWWGLAAGTGVGGAFLAILGLCVVQAVLIGPIVRALVNLASRTALGGRLARRAMLRSIAVNLDEIGVAAAALGIAIAAAIGIGTMVESFRRDFVELLDQRLWQGLVVDGVQQANAGLGDALARLDGVVEVRGYASRKMFVGGMRVDVTATEIDAVEAARYGWPDAVADGVLVNEVGARKLGLSVGDSVTVAGVGFEIVHVFKDFGTPEPRFVAPRRKIGEDWPVQRLTVRTRGEAAPIVAAVREQMPTLEVTDLAEVRRVAVEVFGRTFQITGSLTSVALLVAVFGLYNALAALQLRRQAENRLLYSLGVGKADLVRGAVEQSLLVGAAAAALAMPLGLAIAFVLCNFVNPRAFGWTIQLHFSYSELTVPVLGAIAAAGIAGMIPAVRGLPAITGSFSHVAR